MTTVELKTELLQHCRNQIDNRYSRIKQTIVAIEESLLEESKSSSGDKHETGRAMLQIDRENAGKQLYEIEKVVLLLNKIDVKATSDYVRLGSLVSTERFTYFICHSVGAVTIAKTDFLCVALNSPVGMLLSGKRTGEEFILNGNIHKIIEVS